MRVGDLLLWVTGVPRVTMFGRKSVGSGLTTRYPLNSHSPFAQNSPQSRHSHHSPHSENTPAWRVSRGLRHAGTPVDSPPGVLTSSLAARRAVVPRHGDRPFATGDAKVVDKGSVSGRGQVDKGTSRLRLDWRAFSCSPRRKRFGASRRIWVGA